MLSFLGYMQLFLWQPGICLQHSVHGISGTHGTRARNCLSYILYYQDDVFSLCPMLREGVQFMFECVTGLRAFSNTVESEEPACCGCILADDMGYDLSFSHSKPIWRSWR